MASIVSLDDPAAAQVAVAGAKGAGLARARAAGLPVLDGFVVPASWSAGALQAGRAVLATGGSGAARLAVIRSIGDTLDAEMTAAVVAAAGHLSEPLVVRSSSVLEGGGEWSGAFTSMAEVGRDELPKAIRSVWATCFSLDVLDRCAEAGIEAGSAPMAVLMQPEIAPACGGAASVDASGTVTVDAVVGSPRDLLAGWAPGARAVAAVGGAPTGEAATLLGERRIGAVADLARQVHADLGHNLIEWAVHDDHAVLLQVQSTVLLAGSGAPAPDPANRTTGGAVDPAEVARVVEMYEGMATPRGSRRRGRDRLEVILAGVCAEQGTVVAGRPAVGGFGAGRLVWVDSPARTDHVRPRDVVVAQYPLANFSPLLWDAAGVVTVGGSPGAHLFEVARSLCVPAVVGCPLADVVRDGPVLGMVDGDAGQVVVLG